jgi:threonine dehydratase
MRLPTPDDVVGARARIAPFVVRTPMLRHAALDRITGGTVLLKPESMQRTGSFKLRGATNAIRQLSAAERQAGVVTFSSGNHAQAVACAAAAMGLRATVFMPADAPRVKVDDTRSWGGEVIYFDRVKDDRVALGRAFAERTGAALVPPFEHPDVIAGQGTLALELAEDAAAAGLRLDAFLSGVSGGGLIAGCGLAFASISPATRVWAVEPQGWDDTARSLAAGERVANAPGGSTLCDSLLAETPGALTFALNQRQLAGALVVSDAEVLAAIAFAFRHLKLVLEPGGAVGLAALLAGRFDARGKVIGVVLSGGNVDAAVFRRALAE